MRREKLKRKEIKMLIGLAVLTSKQRHVNCETELGPPHSESAVLPEVGLEMLSFWEN